MQLEDEMKTPVTPYSRQIFAIFKMSFTIFSGEEILLEM